MQFCEAAALKGPKPKRVLTGRRCFLPRLEILTAWQLDVVYGLVSWVAMDESYEDCFRCQISVLTSAGRWNGLARLSLESQICFWKTLFKGWGTGPTGLLNGLNWANLPLNLLVGQAIDAKSTVDSPRTLYSKGLMNISLTSSEIRNAQTLQQKILTLIALIVVPLQTGTIIHTPMIF